MPFGRASRRTFSPRTTHVLIMAVIFIVSAGVRLLPWEHVFADGATTFFDGDCYVRFRKILVYLQAFPKPFIYDYFQGFPVGTGIITPPIMEYLVAALAYPFRHSPALIPILERAVALVPPLLGGMTALFLYLFANRFMGRLAATTAALFLALAPPHIDATLLGRFDNEMVEPLLLLIVYWSYSRTYSRETDLSPWVVTGIASAGYLIFWRGALFPLTIVGIDLLLRLLTLRRENERGAKLAVRAATMYAAAAGIIGLVCVIDPWQSGRLFTYHIISSFHAAIFAAASVLFILATFFFGSKVKCKFLRFFLLVLGFGCVSLFRADIFEGLKVVAGGEAWIDTISEYVPGFSGEGNVYYYGIFGMIAPVVLLSLRSKAWPYPPMTRFMVLWTIVMFAATAARLRFACYYMISAAVMAGILVQFALYLGERYRKALVPAACILLVTLLQAPTWPYLLDTYREGRGVVIDGDLTETMLWLRDSTPSPGDPLNPSVKPSYGIMARWDLDGYVEGIALRPVIATAYGRETYGFEESAKLFLAGTDAEVVAIMRRSKARYLIVDDVVISNLEDFARYLGDKRVFFQPHWDPVKASVVRIPTTDCLSLAFWRLLFADGLTNPARGRFIPPVEGLRLVHESPSSSGGYPWETQRFKVFEVAEGAVLVVRGAPKTMVEVAQPVETNRGRRFVYRSHKEIGADGTVTFKLPYRNKTATGTVGAVAPVTVAGGGKTLSLHLSDQEVDEGRVLSVTVP